jgi:leader peptidase (prepilin peptidase) / N-methyltransferase
MWDELTPVVVVCGAVFGLLIGSFVNVVIYRVPRDLSIVRPASRCPTCGKPLSAFDNIPVLSWIFLRGRCRQCREPISGLYPIVEVTTGILFGAVVLYGFPRIASAPDPVSASGHAVFVVALLWLAGASVALTVIDVQTHRLPNAIVYPTIIVAALSAALSAVALDSVEVFARAMAGGGILFAFYLALALIWKGGMGLGDVKLAAAIGIYLGYVGWEALIVGAFAAFIVGGLASVVLLARGAATGKTAIPFGPCMLIGAWAGIFFGDWIAFAYLRLVGLS